MNVFVLCTGRCGSTTFARACAHMTNFSAGHETRTGLVGDGRLDYRHDHIEVDNRLSWFLGRLEQRYADAFFVHLTRDREATARSFLKRYGTGIVGAYAEHVLMGMRNTDPLRVCLDYVDTVEANIAAFLRGKTSCHVRLRHASTDFALFWQAIGARGDLNAALGEWLVRYNAA